jgi:hypothetical protein
MLSQLLSTKTTGAAKAPVANIRIRLSIDIVTTVLFIVLKRAFLIIGILLV